MTIDNLAAAVLQALNRREMTLSTAESCTGGWLGKLLTDIPGSSAHYLGGVISYTNQVKRELLGVSAEALDTCGAVSDAVARQMAEGVRQRIGADFGVGITGLAGPNGDGSDNPVGLVYIAVSAAEKTLCNRYVFDGDRETVRRSACDAALKMLMNEIR